MYVRSAADEPSFLIYTYLHDSNCKTVCFKSDSELLRSNHQDPQQSLQSLENKIGQVGRQCCTLELFVNMHNQLVSRYQHFETVRSRSGKAFEAMQNKLDGNNRLSKILSNARSALMEKANK